MGVPKQGWTDDKLRELVASSKSWSAVLRGLGLTPWGRNHFRIKARAEALSLATDHFTLVHRRDDDAALREAVSCSTHIDDVFKRLGLDTSPATRRKLLDRARNIGVDLSHLERQAIVRERTSRRRWTDDQLKAAVASSRSNAGVIRALGLIAAGGNYEQVLRRMRELEVDTAHFTGKGWNVGLAFDPRPHVPLDEVLVAARWTSSHGLKKRLFAARIKQPRCEMCGWAEQASDGRVPVELDHINGDKADNRLENLRILCPNCHALQPTHRGLNKKRRKLTLT